MATIIDSNGTPTSESSALSVIDVTLDIRQNRMVSVLLKQYNKQSQQIKFTVTDNGEKIELKEIEHTVLFKMMTPDGRRVSSYCAINENDHTAVLTVAKNYCSYPGKGTAELEVMDALEESQVGTMNLDVVIENSAYPDEMINGSSTYQGLDEKINAVREACNSAITAKEETETIRDECDGIRNTCNDLKEEAQQYKNEAMSYANGESGTRYGEETDNAKYYYQLGLEKEAEYQHNLELTESYMHGGTGTRDGEDTDNAKYYYEQTSSLKSNVESINSEILELQTNVAQKASEAKSFAQDASQSYSSALLSEKNAAISESNAKSYAEQAETTVTNLLNEKIVLVEGSVRVTGFNNFTLDIPNSISDSIGDYMLVGVSESYSGSSNWCSYIATYNGVEYPRAELVMNSTSGNSIKLYATSTNDPNDGDITFQKTVYYRILLIKVA